jgi:hypothetical protein
MPRKKKDESWTPIVGGIALCLFALVGYKTGMFGILSKALVNHALTITKDGEKVRTKSSEQP